MIKDQNNTFQNDIKKIDSFIMKQKEESNKNLINQIQSNMSDKIKSLLQDEIKKQNKENNNAVDLMHEKLKNEIDEIHKELRNMLNSQKQKNEIKLISPNEKASNLTGSDEQQSDSINLRKRRVRTKKPKLLEKCQYMDESEPDGILSMLGSTVELIAGGKCNPNCSI